jgi:glycosyltransferase involved in cell wall biosynthesis
MKPQFILFEVQTGVIRAVSRDGKSRVVFGKLGENYSTISVISSSPIEPGKWIVQDGKLVRKPVYLVPPKKQVEGQKVAVVAEGAGSSLGFGNQAVALGESLKERGFSVEYHSPSTTSREYQWDVDWIVSLGELQQVLRLLDQKLTNWVHWLPLTTKSISEEFWIRLQGVPSVVAMSRFGYDQIKQHYPPEKLFYIPHSVDTRFFKPLVKGSREKVRENYPDLEKSYVVLFVGTNTFRKDIPSLLKAFQLAVKIIGSDDIKLVMKTSVDGSSCKILEQVKDLDIEKRILVIQDRVELQRLVTIYGMSDVYATAAMAEGFGIPLLEALACGIPVIAGDHTTSPEIVGDAGTLVSCRKAQFNLYDYKVEWYPVEVDKFADAIVQHYRLWKSGYKLDRTWIRNKVLTQYSREVVVGRWEDLLSNLMGS